jgi:hypothetical protein
MGYGECPDAKKIRRPTINATSGRRFERRLTAPGQRNIIKIDDVSRIWY